MPTKPVPVYWDSCVYIACIQQEPPRYPELSRILNEATSGKIVLVASTLVIAEVVKLKSSQNPIADQAKLIRDFFENDFIEIKAVDRGIAEDAAELCRNNSGLKPPDAIHIATALRWKCRCFQTYDGEKGKPQTTGTRKHLLDFDGKIGWPSLEIKLPKQMFQSQITMFNGESPA